jgi:hypothetical protein
MSSSRSSGSERAAIAADVAAAVLAGAAEKLRAWSDDDIVAFLSGELELTIRVGAERRTTKTKSGRDDARQLAADVLAALSAMQTREAGLSYLRQLSLNREGLRALVAELDLPATKSDNMERLRERVVEALIGYRLRSQAIRGGGTVASDGRQDEDPQPAAPEPQAEQAPEKTRRNKSTDPDGSGKTSRAKR